MLIAPSVGRYCSGMASLTLPDCLALVTGAGRGVGKGVALALARAGARVAVNYEGSPEEAGQTAEEIRALGAAGR